MCKSRQLPQHIQIRELSKIIRRKYQRRQVRQVAGDLRMYAIDAIPRKQERV